MRRVSLPPPVGGRVPWYVAVALLSRLRVSDTVSRPSAYLLAASRPPCTGIHRASCLVANLFRSGYVLLDVSHDAHPLTPQTDVSIFWEIVEQPNKTRSNECAEYGSPCKRKEVLMSSSGAFEDSAWYVQLYNCWLSRYYISDVASQSRLTEFWSTTCLLLVQVDCAPS